MNRHVVAHAASGAKRRHQRRLRSAVAVFCDAVEANAWGGTRGPCNVMLWEAERAGLDAAALDALIDNRWLQISDPITRVSLPIAA